MNWKLKTLLIWLMGVPALTGFPLDPLRSVLPPGPDYAWLLYGAVVYAAMVILLGRKIFKMAVVIALAITIPLVVLGGLISSVALFINGWSSAEFISIVTHYAGLSATMMVVIPLGLAMITVLPFHRLEPAILESRRGVTIFRKIALMFLRVFSHIFYFVIPNILEVVREEGALKGWGRGAGRGKRINSITRVLVNIGVESICSAIRFVPLWADEISMLPGRKPVDKTMESKISS